MQTTTVWSGVVPVGTPTQPHGLKGFIIDYTSIAAGADGKRIAKAGTIMGHATINLLVDDTAKASPQNGATSQVILMDDVDCTYGDTTGSFMVHGAAYLDDVSAVQVPAANAITALAGRIYFRAK